MAAGIGRHGEKTSRTALIEYLARARNGPDSLGMHKQYRHILQNHRETFQPMKGSTKLHAEKELMKYFLKRPSNLTLNSLL